MMDEQLELDFDGVPMRLLWEFDLGDLHFMVSEDEVGDLWLDSRPAGKKRKRGRR